jgi:MbtH protein
MTDPQADAVTHTVVVNAEEQYSTWPGGRALPSGWRSTGITGSKSDCLQRIALMWTDMRPLSLRRRMDG